MESLLWALVFLVIALSCSRSAQAAEAASTAHVQGPEPDLGPPISAWYFSLRTSKGYCGLVPATAAAGGYGYVIACNNKLPQYAVQITLLVPPVTPGYDGTAGDSGLTGVIGDSGSGVYEQQGHGNQGLAEHGDGQGPRAPGRVQNDGEQQQGQGWRAQEQQQQQGGKSGAAAGVNGQETGQDRKPVAGRESGTFQTDPSDPILLTTGRPVRLLLRNAGLCNTPPLPSPPAGGSVARSFAAAAATDTVDDARGDGATDPSVATSLDRQLRAAVSATARKVRAGVLRTAMRLARGGDGGGGAAIDGSGRSLDDEPVGPLAVAISDLPPRAVTCSPGHPAEIMFRVYRSDLKDGEEVDVGKEWVYLMEGDKYCTLADVSGLSAVISCHLDSPGWTGYKFQLQPAAYPRTELLSLLTGSPCGVLNARVPGPHDVECWTWEQGERQPEVDLVLQSPGAALSAGVVVGFSTFTGEVIGQEAQRCCTAASSPHILLCEPPATAAPGTPVPGECWFQLYDVKLATVHDDSYDVDEEEEETRGRHGGERSDESTSSSTSSGTSSTFWLNMLRILAAEMSPAGLDPDLGFLDGGGGGQEGHGGGSDSVVGSAGPHDGSTVSVGGQHSSGSSSSRGWAEMEKSGTQRGAAGAAGVGMVGVMANRKRGGGREGGSLGGRDVKARVGGPQEVDWRPDPQHPMDGEEEEGEEEDENGDTTSGPGSVAGDMRLQPSSLQEAVAQRLQHNSYGDSEAAWQTDEEGSDSSSRDGGDGGVLRWLQWFGVRPTALAWSRWGLSWRPSAGGGNYVMITRDRDDMAAVEGGGGGGSPNAVTAAAAAAAARRSRVSRGGGWWLGGAAASLGDGSLVMVLSKAFGRYCSVSVDGTLLCVSAQASNASRNLFMLAMPSEAGRGGVRGTGRHRAG